MGAHFAPRGASALPDRRSSHRMLDEEAAMFAYDYPLLGVFWSLLMFFCVSSVLF